METSYNIEDLIKAVKKEAQGIRAVATIEERSRLNFNTFDPEWWGDCIYGQMTGDCFNARAGEMIFKCAVPFSSSFEGYTKPTASEFDDSITRKQSNYRSATAIEFYINLDDADNVALIDYLKGKTETLELPVTLINS